MDEPQNIMLWGYEEANKNTWTLEYEDSRMCGCQQAHMKPKVWGCEDAKIQVCTHEPEDMRKQGCEDIHMNPMYKEVHYKIHY